MNIKIPVSWLRDYLKTDVEAKTNRPDVFSVWGLEREANAILQANGQKSQLVAPKGLDTKLEPDKTQKFPLDVLIRDKSLCQRFTAIVIDNVKIKPSPAIIKNRLEASGIRAINNIVDISNYIMLELGQPMHTFDYDKIKGAKMILRQSIEAEKIKTLDGQTHKLPEGSIVIEDNERLIDLCGIMGGANSRVTSRTKGVVLFVQAYNQQLIRKTTQSLAFRTEASTRFRSE